MKRIVSMIFILLIAITLASCDSSDDTYLDSGNKDKDVIEVTMEEMTITQLGEYDGKDGMKAYVAVNDVIYDVSDIWESGEHNGYSAGTDITDFIDNAPHGDSVLSNLEQVGVLITE